MYRQGFCEFTGSGRLYRNNKTCSAEKADRAEAWLPYPLSDAFQTISGMTLKSDADSMGVEREPQSGALYLRASWAKPSQAPTLTMRFDVDSHYAKIENLDETRAPFPVEALPFLEASPSIPSEDLLFAEVGARMKEEPSILKRAYAVYSWVVENTFRDEGVKEGCGLGLPIRTLQDLKGGGKCAHLMVHGVQPGIKTNVLQSRD